MSWSCLLLHFFVAEVWSKSCTFSSGTCSRCWGVRPLGGLESLNVRSWRYLWDGEAWSIWLLARPIVRWRGEHLTSFLGDIHYLPPMFSRWEWWPTQASCAEIICMFLLSAVYLASCWEPWGVDYHPCFVFMASMIFCRDWKSWVYVVLNSCSFCLRFSSLIPSNTRAGEDVCVQRKSFGNSAV